MYLAVRNSWYVLTKKKKKRLIIFRVVRNETLLIAIYSYLEIYLVYSEYKEF